MIATMHVPFVDLQAHHAAIRGDVERAVRALLDRGDFILGGEVERFEAEYASFIGTRHAIGVGTGLDQGVNRGDVLLAVVAEHDAHEQRGPAHRVDVVERSLGRDQRAHDVRVSKMRGRDQRGTVIVAGDRARIEST